VWVWVWCGCAPPHKISEFYKCYIFVYFITIRSNHYLWSLAPCGHAPAFPLKYALDYTTLFHYMYIVEQSTHHPAEASHGLWTVLQTIKDIFVCLRPSGALVFDCRVQIQVLTHLLTYLLTDMSL